MKKKPIYAKSCRSALLVIDMLNGVIEPSPCRSRRGSPEGANYGQYSQKQV
jgi:hypothetical protein